MVSTCQSVEGRTEEMLPRTRQNSVMTNIKTVPLWYNVMVVGWGDWILLRPVRTSLKLGENLGVSPPCVTLENSVFCRLTWTSAEVGLQFPACSLGSHSCWLFTSWCLENCRRIYGYLWFSGSCNIVMFFSLFFTC